MITPPEQIEISATVSDEFTFKRIWQATAEEPDILSRAFKAGLASDRLSWVFIAGYQSALRRVFKHLPEKEWWAFAVSEDKTGELPGVSLSDGCLNGVKTWVATSKHLDGAIVTAGRSCYRVSAHTQGAALEHSPPAEFLGEMSVGKLTLTNLEAGESVSMTGDFGIAEPTFLAAASCGFLLRETKRLAMSGMDERIRLITADLSNFYDTGPESDIKELHRIYCLVSDLGKECGSMASECGDRSAGDWAVNGKLLGLYKRGLASRIES
ncbi:MAG: hypothetical protein HOC70_02045 [Gammaproteobacteria bacterium]|nr:hypothetical protein [Gammaproteobacteria bacterium]MBT4491997.1 hypothetical protein [Gammaproteobacteria bacterium]MBT7370730.1 hypothetical protein [Gammaproteobacteria bacterium]